MGYTASADSIPVPAVSRSHEAHHFDRDALLFRLLDPLAGALVLAVPEDDRLVRAASIICVLRTTSAPRPYSFQSAG
jgi:hypothetical protein